MKPTAKRWNTMAPKPSPGRSIETGAILGILTLILVVTGLLLSPSVGAYIPGYGEIQAFVGSTLYVTHMASAAMLIAFLTWHLLPFGHSFRAKPGVKRAARLTSYALLAFTLVEIVTGVVLYLRAYDIINKPQAVMIHLATTFLVIIPIAPHALRGYRVWRKRRDAREAAIAAAERAGKGATARQTHADASRRVFLRLSAYAIAGLALATAFGRYTAGQLKAWRLNFVGPTPRLEKDTYRLRVTGLVNQPIELTYADILSLPATQQEITLRCVEGWTYRDTFTGTALRHVLDRAGGTRPGAAQLVFKSAEVSTQRSLPGVNYSSNFPVQDGLHDDILLVYRVQGIDLPREHGYPVRLLTGRKWGYKNTKWLTEIEVVGDPAYRGYWERQGYHNDGDWPGPIFG